MSRGSQIAIGIVSALLGAAVLSSGLVVLLYADSAEAAVGYVMFDLGAIAFCIAIACFFPGSRPVTMRLIGLVLLAGGVVGLKGWMSDAEPAPVQAYVFGITLAGGGLWMAVTGYYPKWGAYGGALAIAEEENARRQRKDSFES